MQTRTWKNDQRPDLWRHKVPPVYLLVLLCCILLAVGFSLRAVFASVSAKKDAPAVQQPAWSAEGAVTVYGGAYTVVISNMRFEPAGDASPHRKLVADLLYSNLSPFVVHIERSSRIQAVVLGKDGSPLKIFSADSPQELPPGGAVLVPISLGTDYGVALHAGEQLSVLFTDAGGNLAGRITPPLDD